MKEEKSIVDNIIKEYNSKKNKYSTLMDKTKDLTSYILEINHIKFHSIEARLKSKESLKKKMSRPGSGYTKLSSITDIVGIRIITYFSDDVDKISEIIKSEFEVDFANSIDKRKLLDPDRFGYLSLHYIVSHSSKRTLLPEYRDIKGLFLEIQIRSILQHAWAEMEHDLGYKSSIEIPNNLKRRFSRVAGLLELSDEEFVSIRNEIQDYADSIALIMDEEPKSILLDGTSLSIFVQANPTVNKIDKELSDIFKASKFAAYKPSIELQMLKDAGVRTIEELKNALESNIDNIPKFAKLWISGEKDDTISHGLSLFYLAYILIAQLDDFERERKALIGLAHKENDDGAFVNKLRETYINSIKT